jgi:hypothetical protein
MFSPLDQLVYHTECTLDISKSLFFACQAIVEDIDEDRSGQLEFEEFVMLSAR